MGNVEIIKRVNKLTSNYIMLRGISGQIIDKDNAILKYLSYSMFINGLEETPHNETVRVSYIIDINNGLESKTDDIPNDIFHPFVQEAFNMYNKITKRSNVCDTMIKDKIQPLLTGDYDDFVGELESTYMNCFLYIIQNYESKFNTYNDLKISVFEKEIENSVKLEDYDTAIIYTDKIKELKTKKESGI